MTAEKINGRRGKMRAIKLDDLRRETNVCTI